MQRANERGSVAYADQVQAREAAEALHAEAVARGKALEGELAVARGTHALEVGAYLWTCSVR